MSDETPTTAPKWTYSPKGDTINDDTRRSLALKLSATDDEMRLMASAPDLARALRGMVRSFMELDYFAQLKDDKETHPNCRLSDDDEADWKLICDARAILSALSIVPEE